MKKNSIPATKSRGDQHGGRRSGSSKGLQTKLIKGSRTVKGRKTPFRLFYTRGIERKVSTRIYRFVVVALERYRLRAKQLEAGRKLLRKYLGNKGLSVLIRAYPFAPVTKRSQDIRMGKGKSSRISAWTAPVRPGKVLFEVDVHSLHGLRLAAPARLQGTINRNVLGALEKVRTKLPIRVRIALLNQ